MENTANTDAHRSSMTPQLDCLKGTIGHRGIRKTTFIFASLGLVALLITFTAFSGSSTTHDKLNMWVKAGGPEKAKHSAAELRKLAEKLHSTADKLDGAAHKALEHAMDKAAHLIAEGHSKSKNKVHEVGTAAAKGIDAIADQALKTINEITLRVHETIEDAALPKHESKKSASKSGDAEHTWSSMGRSWEKDGAKRAVHEIAGHTKDAVHEVMGHLKDVAKGIPEV